MSKETVGQKLLLSMAELSITKQEAHNKFLETLSALVKYMVELEQEVAKLRAEKETKEK